MAKKKFNAILFKNHTSTDFVYMEYKENEFKGEAFKVTVADDFMCEEKVDGVFPDTKVVLADVCFEGQDMLIEPKYCVNLSFGGKPFKFWNVAENLDYLEYFLFKMNNRL